MDSPASAARGDGFNSREQRQLTDDRRSLDAVGARQRVRPHV